MRRYLTRLLCGFAIIFASLALCFHVVSLVAFDPGRPVRVASAMLKTDEGQHLATEAISAQLRELVPVLTDERADAVAAQVASDPALTDALDDAGGAGTPQEASDVLTRAVVKAAKRVDPAVGKAARRQLKLDRRNGVVDPATDWTSRLVEEVPLASAKARVSSWAWTSLVLAFTLAGAALLIGPGRDRVLRRLGRWQVGAAAAGLLAWVAVPNLVLPHLPGAWPVVLAAGLHAAGFGLAGTFTALLVCGGITWAAGVAGSMMSPVLHVSETPRQVRHEAKRQADLRRKLAELREQHPGWHGWHAWQGWHGWPGWHAGREGREGREAGGESHGSTGGRTAEEKPFVYDFGDDED